MEKGTHVQLGGGRSSGRPEAGQGAAAKVAKPLPLSKSGVIPGSPKLPVAQGGTLVNSTDAVSPRPSASPRKAPDVNSPKPPPRGEAPRSPRDAAVSTPKSPRAAVDSGGGGGGEAPKSPRSAPTPPSRDARKSGRDDEEQPKSPRKPMAGAVALFGGEIKAGDLKHGSKEKTPPPPSGGKPIAEQRSVEVATPEKERGRKKTALFPPLLRVRLAGGIVAIELVPGDDVEGVVSSIETLELPKPHALVAVTPDMGSIAVLPDDMDMNEVMTKYPGCSLFEMAADKHQWKAQRTRYFSPEPGPEEGAPKKKVLAVEVQLPGHPLEVIKVLLTEIDTGTSMVAKILRKLRQDENQKGSLILLETGCRDYYVGATEYAWYEVERRGTQSFRAVFRMAGPDDELTVNLTKLLAECAEPMLKPVEYRNVTTVADLMQSITAPAGTELALVVTDLPERPLKADEVLYEALCMFHPEDAFLILIPIKGN